MANYTAYLIVVCDKETNTIVGADIWSSPEWEQSQRIPNYYTYIAYMYNSAYSFQDARDGMIEFIKNNYVTYGTDRYYRILKLVKGIENE